MGSFTNLFDYLDRFLDKFPGIEKLDPQIVAEKKYMYTQVMVSITLLTVMGIVAEIISAKLIVEFCLVYITIMLVGMLLFRLLKKLSDIILVYKITMIVISSIYIMRMGGLHTSGGLFLLAMQAVTSTIILRKYWKILVVAFSFISFITLLIAFQSFFPTENALTPIQNRIIFSMSLLGITVYIIFFSLYAINLFRKMDHREIQRQKELNDAKTRLYTNITHEFRTPLTVILGMADSIRNNGQNSIPEKIDAIIQNGKNLLQLVDQMLDLNKLESGRMSVNKIEANIIPFLKYIFQLQEFYAEEKNISMFFTSESQSCFVEFDPEKIAAIVSNLLSNAIKFTSEKGQIRMVVYKEERNICIEIKDNGIGIPQKELDCIFDRFYQVDGEHTRKEEGAGIGLALTKEFVQLLKGSLEVKSNIGIGTVFTVKFPVTNLTSKSAAKSNFNNEILLQDISDCDNLQQINSNGHQRLLIIEDNPDVVAYLHACYQNHFLILNANNGKEGYKIAIQEIPDIIVSDVMMPQMDGFELCEKLKEDLRTSHIPIVLLTAKADIPSRIEGLEQGADAYVVKPFNQQELLVRMKKLIELRRKMFRKYSIGNELEFSEDKFIQKENKFFKRLNQIIQNNLDDENFNVQMLCREMAMSKSQLYRKFNALTDKSVAKYIRSVRMQKAKELLQSTSMNITEISYSIGIKTVSTFSQLFKEEFGVSPKNYFSRSN